MQGSHLNTEIRPGLFLHDSRSNVEYKDLYEEEGRLLNLIKYWESQSLEEQKLNCENIKFFKRRLNEIQNIIETGESPRIY